jgi:ABC-type branched-subunit amino acid transport system ATPase component
MAGLLLDSLEIRRFRAFRHLRIEKLGRVNLIVGKNNVGKSCLLEALELYAKRAHPTCIWQILATHDEDTRPLKSARGYPDDTLAVEEVLPALKYLFYGRQDITFPIEPIEIGPIDRVSDKLTLSIELYTQTNQEGRSKFSPLPIEDYANAEDPIPRFSVQLGEDHSIHYPLDLSSSRLQRSELKEIACVLVAASELDKRKISGLWSKIALTNQQKEVIAALRIIAPGVQDINVIEDPDSRRERFPIIKVANMAEPLPIRSLGNGIQRALEIVLALVNTKNGLLLIDEVEHGLHHWTQTEFWQLIFEISHKLNIQVFATTHNWDCIDSFQQAAQENEHAEGMLIRLNYKNGDVSATLFNEQSLATIIQEQIEVR